MKPEIIALNYIIMVLYVFGGGWLVIRRFLGTQKGMVRTRPAGDRWLFAAGWVVGLALVLGFLTPR